jgi:hypothetical protein
MRTASSLVLISLAALAGCPAPRTTAATRPTPAAFDAAKSDPAALAQVDAGMAALGGSAEKWSQVKELRFNVALKVEGKAVARFEHSWDRWNGRHALRTADMRTAGNREDDIKWHDVRYDLFSEGGVYWVSYAKQEALRADYDKAAADARVRFNEDSYRVSLPYRLRDPGVHLALGDNVAPTAGACEPSCVSIKVTFDPEVGSDTWYVYYNKNTNVPEIIAQETAKGRLNHRIAAWAEAGGMKWPSQLVNIGAAGEVFEFSSIAVGEPRDSAYGRDL